MQLPELPFSLSNKYSPKPYNVIRELLPSNQGFHSNLLMKVHHSNNK